MRAWVGATAVVVGAGCSEFSGNDSSFAVVDSADAGVLATPVAIWDTERPWTLEPEPSLRIGLTEGDAPYLFQDIRGVVQLGDGRIVVADGLSRELRFFDDDGAHLRTVGRLGQGPGEFESLSWLELCGEGLYAFDRRQRRVSVWSLEGEVLESFPLREPNGDRGPYASRCGPAGRFVMAGWGERPPRETGASFVLYKQPASLWLVHPSTQEVADLGTYVSSERVFAINPVTGGSGTWPHPFGRSVVFALDSAQVYIGTSERLQIEVRRHDGRLLRILRGPDIDLSITADFIARYRAAEMSRPDSILRDRLEENEMQMTPLMPAYTRLLLDALGNLWVERFEAFSSGSSRWGVFAADGRFNGHLDMPNGFRMMGVAADRIVGISEDAFGVERVETYRLHRNRP